MKENIHFPAGFTSETDSTILTPEQIDTYSFLIRTAKRARAYPDQSGFFVRTAGITKNGVVWSGGNKEYSHSDAFIHGETAVVSGLRDQTDSPIDAIAWYRDKETGPGDFGRPCGNCRDILRKYCGPETILLNGNETGFVYTKLKDFIFDNFKANELNNFTLGLVPQALRALRASTDVYLPEPMKKFLYSSLLIGDWSPTWPGSHYSNVGYDSVTPVLGSVISWKNSYPFGTISKRSLHLSKLLVVSETGIPDVFYRDRQAILELDEVVRRFTKKGPLKIELVHAKESSNGSLVIHDSRITDTEEWLPHPFSPGAFRMDDVMDEQLAKLIGR